MNFFSKSDFPLNGGATLKCFDSICFEVMKRFKLNEGRTGFGLKGKGGKGGGSGGRPG